METIETVVGFAPTRHASPLDDRDTRFDRTVLLVRDDDQDNMLLDAICEFLDIGTEYTPSAGDIGPLLRALRPIAVIADLDGAAQDGFHVMKTAAAHDPDLPVVLLSNGDPALAGAIDAVREVWGLTRVTAVTGVDDIGVLVDFLCHAARDAGMSRMMRVWHHEPAAAPEEV